MKIDMKLLFLALMVLFVGCSNDAVSGHEVVPIAGDVSSSAVTQSSSSREIVEHSSSSSADNLSSAEESSSSSESLSSSSESVESSSSLEEQELSSSSSSFEGKSSSSSLVVIYGEMTDERDGQVYKTIYVEGFDTAIAAPRRFAPRPMPTKLLFAVVVIQLSHFCRFSLSCTICTPASVKSLQLFALNVMR